MTSFENTWMFFKYFEFVLKFFGSVNGPEATSSCLASPISHDVTKTQRGGGQLEPINPAHCAT